MVNMEYYWVHSRKSRIIKTTKKYRTRKKKDIDEIITNNLIGNHMVTALNIPNKDITLIVDPTNLELEYIKMEKYICFFQQKRKMVFQKDF